MAPDVPRMMTVKEFAERNSLSEHTVERRCLDKTLVCVKLGKSVRIPEDALVTLAQEQGWVRS